MHFYIIRSSEFALQNLKLIEKLQFWKGRLLYIKTLTYVFFKFFLTTIVLLLYLYLKISLKLLAHFCNYALHFKDKLLLISTFS